MEPINFEHHRMIVGYHGCDRGLVEQVILHGEPLKPSQNRWDWLGEGIYFWEYGLQRAFEFACEQKLRGKVEHPAILGAYIHLGRCFDLTDTRHPSLLAKVFDTWKEQVEARGHELPTNQSISGQGGDLLLRFRDCALINWLMQELDTEKKQKYFHTVRGVFVEGQPVYPNAGIFTKTHIQIAVRDTSCIVGYFVPPTLS